MLAACNVDPAGGGGECQYCSPYDDGGNSDKDEDEDENDPSSNSGPDDSDDEDKDDPDDTPGTGSGSGLPCEVRDALATNCWGCHGTDPTFGAPMPLADYDDLQVPAVTDVTRSTYEMTAERIIDPVRPMPPEGNMSQEDVQVLLDWVASGTPKGETDCGDAPKPDMEKEGPEYLDCEVSHEMTASADGAGQAFHVPEQGADNLYQCFAFKSPFPAGMQATAWAPIIDDERVVHHWILYRTNTPPQAADGGNFPCDVTLQLTTTFVAGWAPGGGNTALPSNVGLELGSPDDWYILQVHYHNTANYADSFDKSGVAFCTTPTPREETAGILTLGTIGIDIPAGAEKHEEIGTCGFFSTIGWTEDVHILGGAPHMHALGRGFRTELFRGFDPNGEMVTEIPIFDWENRKMHWNTPEMVVKPGDRLTTTCIFDNPYDFNVPFGEGSEDEMCFNFVLAYPIDAIPDRNCGIIF